MSEYRKRATEERRRRILDIAGEMFLERGYEAVSTADIVRRIGGSKATLYAYFPSKAQLFVAIVADQVQSVAEIAADFLQERSDVGATLQRLGNAILTVTLSPKMIGLYRIGVAELYRHPEITHELDKLRQHFNGPVVEYFRRTAKRGELSISDPELASDQFRELCGARHFNNVLLGLGEMPTPEQRHVAVEEAVELFLKGYSERSDELPARSTPGGT